MTPKSRAETHKESRKRKTDQNHLLAYIGLEMTQIATIQSINIRRLISKPLQLTRKFKCPPIEETEPQKQQESEEVNFLAEVLAYNLSSTRISA